MKKKYVMEDGPGEIGPDVYELEVGIACPFCGDDVLIDAGDDMLVCPDGCGSYFSPDPNEEETK
jgi:hypothetical protein